jgi:hypothetical protein
LPSASLEDKEEILPLLGKRCILRNLAKLKSLEFSVHERRAHFH